jgi:DNA-binding beta-propeller fold protein YncE
MRSKMLFSVAATALLVGTVAVPTTAAAQPPLRSVLLVGNAYGGTVSFIDETTFENLGSIDVIPDLQQRLREMNVVERAAYEIVKAENGDKLVDDAFVAPDGRTMYVSRANLPDVVAIDLVTHQQVWRFELEGFHADHMAMSPDGTKIIVSDTTAGKAQVVDARTGTEVAEFPTGAYPHANDYSPDGSRLYNSSIGITSLPQWMEWAKGAKQLTVVDPNTFRVTRTYQFDHGVRPAVFMPDNKTMYAQLSYLNGFIEYDLVAGRIVRTVEMPYGSDGEDIHPDDYPGNSAHHGMAVSGDGRKLCMAGTIDDYAAVVSVPALTTDRIIPVGDIPYWTQTSRDGRNCYVSMSGEDEVAVISYATAQEIARIPVGDFPQRERNALVSEESLAALSPANG